MFSILIALFNCIIISLHFLWHFDVFDDYNFSRQKNNALLNEIQVYKFKIFSTFDNAKVQCIVCFDR